MDRARGHQARSSGSYGRRIAALVALLCAVALPLAGLAFADKGAEGEIPKGISIGGVDVGGMTAGEALSELSRAIGEPAARPVRVSVDDETVSLSAERAGVRVDLQGAVDRAIERGRTGNFITRGWRAVTGGKIREADRVAVTVDRRAVRRFVAGLAERYEVAPVEASLSIAVDAVTVTKGKDGRRLGSQKALTRKIIKQLRNRGSKRRVAVETVPVEPTKTTDDLWAGHDSVVTVSKSRTTVRLFSRDGLEKTYKVAVGDPKYPTPEGTFTVQTMQVNPTWNVPNSEWAGKLAGQTIPSGDPRNPLIARWIGFDGSVGFHGTKSINSLGTAASHGCVRMAPSDIIDLYKRVGIGTTVFVAA